MNIDHATGARALRPIRNSLFALCLASLAAGQVHETLRLDALVLEGGLPAAALRPWRAPGSMPSVHLDGAGEAYVTVPGAELWQGRSIAPGDLVLSLGLPEAGTVRGTMIFPEREGAQPTRHLFHVDVRGTDELERVSFLRSTLFHYARLHEFDLPGAAWFRYRADAARAELAQLGVFPVLGEVRLSGNRRRRPGELQDSYDVLTGGRALSENLQLDRVLEPEEDTRWVRIDELKGITTREMDWTNLVRGIEPDLDPLARHVPFDQHAVFFPSFAAFTRVLDEARINGAPILELLEASSENARTRERYERQLCLGLDTVTRLLGDQVVTSVAVTGGDPYLRTGSDVALLFETRTPAVLQQHVLSRHGKRIASGEATEVGGRVGGRSYTGVRSADRSVHSLMLVDGDVVVISNSLVQLERIAALMDDASSSLARLPEYHFFRDRYTRGAPDEAALVVITDATIRRWCSPRWRIAAARRTRAGAILADRTANLVSAHANGRAIEPEVDSIAELRIPGGGAVLAGEDGVRSEVYGTARFLTPISELNLDLITLAERDAYEGFRSRYQSRWRTFFDPIAARVTVEKERLALDLTVMPLIAGSQYRELMEVTGAKRIGRQSGDRHPEALLHMVMALDPESWLMGYVADSIRKEDPGISNPLGWLGDGFAVYLEPAPILKEAAEDTQRFLRDHFQELPVGLFIESRDARGLEDFMGAVYAMVVDDGSGRWTLETREHEGHEYVAVLSPSDDQGWMNPFFATHWDGLTVSLHEGVVQRAIERAAARRAGSGPGRSPSSWLRESLVVRVDETATELMRAWWRARHARELQTLALDTLPILNEWKRLFPDEDPLDVHERWFGVRLVCPVSTGFEWDAAWHTWSSTTYGHPAAPRTGSGLSPAMEAVRGLDFGLTFEHDGLRARAELRR